MPLSACLVNEVVLPLALKDAFNGLKPEQDYDVYISKSYAGELLGAVVLRPELEGLLNALYGVPHPEGVRDDLVSIFFTGMTTTKPFTPADAAGRGLRAGRHQCQPAGGGAPGRDAAPQPGRALRPGVDGSLCSPEPNYKLGLLGGDVCGFPNGRRLQDDITEIELLAVAGAAYSVLTEDKFDFNPDLIRVLNDGVDANDSEFGAAFPYLAQPHRGLDFRSNANWGATD